MKAWEALADTGLMHEYSYASFILSTPHHFLSTLSKLTTIFRRVPAELQTTYRHRCFHRVFFLPGLRIEQITALSSSIQALESNKSPLYRGVPIRTAPECNCVPSFRPPPNFAPPKRLLKKYASPMPSTPRSSSVSGRHRGTWSRSGGPYPQTTVQIRTDYLQLLPVFLPTSPSPAWRPLLWHGLLSVLRALFSPRSPLAALI